MTTMKGSVQFLAIWAKAKERYAEETGQKMDATSFPQPSSVQDLEASLERQNNNFAEFRGKKAKIFKVLNDMCYPIVLLNKLAPGGPFMADPPSSFCFGAIMCLIEAAHGVSAYYDAIIDLMDKLKDFLIRLGVYTQEDISAELTEKLARILAMLIKIFARSTKIMKSAVPGRFHQMGKNIIFGHDKKLDEMVAKLGAMTESETQLVGAESRTDVKRIGRKVDDLFVTQSRGNSMMDLMVVEVQQLSLKGDDSLNEIRQGLGKVISAINEGKLSANEDQNQYHLDKVRNILCPSVHPEVTFDSINKSRVFGTGDWVRSEGPFKSWLIQEKKESPILLILGNPGSGKTYVCGNIISYLEQQYPQGSQHASRTSICYFFFKDNDDSTRSFHQALNDLAHQISLNDPVYAKYLGSILRSARDIASLPSKWKLLFFNYFLKKENVDSKVYMVLDGVEEAFQAELKSFLQQLIDLKNAALNNSRGAMIHIVMVGRPHIVDEVEETLGEFVPQINITKSKNKKDIVDYIRDRIITSKVLKVVEIKLQEEILKTVAEKANGMFMWAFLMMQELRQKKRASHIRESLHRAPKGLEEMLRHVLKGFSSTLNGDDSDDLNTMLMWVTCATRPLSLRELDVILRLQSPEGDAVLSLENTLRKQFASFFVLTRQKHLFTVDLQAENSETESASDEEGKEGLDDVENETPLESKSSTTTVAFCHASIGDFFRDVTKRGGNRKISSGPKYPAIGVDIIEAKVGILKECLNLICNYDARAKKIPDCYVFYDYVSKSWLTHLKEAAEILEKVGAAHLQEIGTLLVKMLRDETIISNWAGEIIRTFFTIGNLNLLKKWLEYPELYEALALKDRQWIKEIQANEAEIFRPSARVYAIRWLHSASWRPHGCMLYIHTVLNLLLGRVDQNFPQKVPLQYIVEAAEWAGFEQTALWHERLAECLLENRHYDEALQHFEKALELNPTTWMAKYGIASTFAARGDYQKAIETIQTRLLTENREVEPIDSENGTQVDRAAPHSLLAKCYSRLMDSKSAVENYMKALEIDEQRYDSVYECIILLGSEEKYKEIISLLRGLVENPYNEEYTNTIAKLDLEKDGELISKHKGWYETWKYTNLITTISRDFRWQEFFSYVLRASRETEQLPWLQDVYEKAVVATKKRLLPVIATTLEVCLAMIYMSMGGEEEKLEHLLDNVFKLLIRPRALENSTLWSCEELMAQKYGSYCLQKAYSADNDSEEARYAGKLERFCKIKPKGTDDAPEVITTSFLAVYLGLWHHLRGKEEAAREYLKPRLKKALMILSDEDPSNDDHGYSSLAKVLVAAGQDESARAVLHVFHPTFKRRGDSEDEIFRTEDENDDGGAENSPTSVAINGGKEDQARPEVNKEIGGDDKPTPEKVRTDKEIDAAAGTTNSPKRSQSAMDLAREKYPKGKWVYPWGCDGPCARYFPLYINASMCRICLRDLCDDCLKLVQDGHESVRLLCSKDHNWLHIDPPEKEVDEGEILIGDKVMKLEEFLREIREQWAL